MRKLTTAAILTATAAALAYRPVREWLGVVMIDTGIRLVYGEPPPMTPREPRPAMPVAHGLTMDAAALDRLDAEIRKTRRNGNAPI